MFSRLFALLEPRGMRDQLRLFLEVDPHGGAVFNLDTQAFRGGQYLPGYQRLLVGQRPVPLPPGARLRRRHGRRQFLDRRIGSDIASHLEGLATAWRCFHEEQVGRLRHHRQPARCVPTYTHESPRSTPPTCG
jgi:hypothetical protein